MRNCRRRAIAWLGVVLIGDPRAQESAPGTGADPAASLRGRVFGDVRDARGAAWGGAEVVLVSRPIPSDPDIGEEDRVEATTDRDGRFHAEILRGRPYTAWAWGAVSAEGRRATRVMERVFVQRPVVLQEAVALRARSVQLTQREHWAAHDPFELRVVDGTGNRQVTWLAVGDSGRVTLPWLVGPDAWIEVHGTRPCRYPILRHEVARTAPDSIEIELPEAVRATCWVREFDTGDPCPGAIVLRQLGKSTYPIGATDAAGRLALTSWKHAVSPSAPQTFAMTAAHGVGMCPPIAHSRMHATDAGPKRAGADDFWCSLSLAPPLHVRVLGPGRQPVVGLPVWCSCSAYHKPSRSSGMSSACRLALTTDERGAFAVPGAMERSQAAVHLVLRERDLDAMPPAWRRGLCPVVLAPLAGQSGLGTATDPVVVDLCRMCPLDVEVIDAKGTPAADAALAFSPLSDATWGPWGGDDARADQFGRLRILVPGGRSLGMRATHGLALLIRAFETTVGRPAAAPAVARFTLPQPTAIHGELLLPSGEPATGMTVCASFGTNNQPADWTYQSQDRTGLADRDRNAVRVFVPDKPREALMLTSLIGRPVEVDAQGCFAIPMPSDPVPDLLIFAGRYGAQGFSESMLVRWTGETVQDVTFTVRR